MVTSASEAPSRQPRWLRILGWAFDATSVVFFGLILAREFSTQIKPAWWPLVGIVWGALGLAHILARARYPGPETTPPREPSPAAAGLLVVVGTGLAATVALMAAGLRKEELVTLVGTFALAWLVHRFARRNADRIGQARFDANGDPLP